MRNLMKLIAITAMTALLLFALVTCAAADEKIYTSPVFKLPLERLQRAEEIIQAQTEEEQAAPEEAGEQVEETGEQTEESGEPAEGSELPEGSEALPEGSEQGLEGFDEDGFDEDGLGEEGFEEDEFGEDGGLEEFGDEAGELEPDEPLRQVRIYSSQGAVVTEGDPIYLTSELIGFDGLNVSYQWQVDRGDGLGWVDINGGTQSRYTYIANKETIQYSWRLIVNIVE